MVINLMILIKHMIILIRQIYKRLKNYNQIMKTQKNNCKSMNKK